MSTLFVFIDEWDEQGYHCLVLSEQKEVLVPLAKRSLPEIAELSIQRSTMLVLSCEKFSLHTLALPLLSDKKIRQALPYALEDNLTQAIEELHFSFDRRYAQGGRYLVAVCSRDYLLNIIAQFTEHAVRFDSITVDWFALNTQEATLLEKSVLIHADSFQGVLSISLALNFFKKNPAPQTLYCFKNSASPAKFKQLSETLSAKTCKSTAASWIAERLLEKKPMDLCQGIFQLKKTTNQIKRWYQLAAGLFGLWLATFLFLNSYLLYVSSQKLHTVELAIEQNYRHFFPQAKQIINPRFRITQLLKSSDQAGNESFWLLFSKLATTVEKNQAKNAVTIEQIQSRNHILLVNLSVSDFKTLDAFENSLKQAGLQVKQTQASTQNKRVLSTLELSL